MEIENQPADPAAEKRLETILGLVTGAVGAFFLVVTLWFGKSIVVEHRVGTGTLIFLLILFSIAYWFSKLTYKLFNHNCQYLLSNLELTISGWFFISFVPFALLYTLILGYDPNIKELLRCVPGILYGYYALKLVRKRKVL